MERAVRMEEYPPRKAMQEQEMRLAGYRQGGGKA